MSRIPKIFHIGYHAHNGGTRGDLHLGVSMGDELAALQSIGPGIARSLHGGPGSVGLVN